MTLKTKPKAARFEELIAPLEKKVYFTCLHLMGKREDAEESIGLREQLASVRSEIKSILQILQG